MNKPEDIIEGQMVLKSVIEEMTLNETTHNFEREGESKAKMVREFFFPKEGGLLVKFHGFEHPRKGYPDNLRVTIVDNMKKAIMGVLTTPMILMLPFSWRKFVNQLWLMIEFIRMKPGRYCKTAYAVYKAIPNEKVRDIICMILEFDSAYRYRFQDVFGEISKGGFLEVFSAFETLEEREFYQEGENNMAKKWRKIKYLVFLAWFLPSVRKFFRTLNYEAIKMDEADLFWAKRNTTYDWGGEIGKIVLEKRVEELQANLKRKCQV